MSEKNFSELFADAAAKREAFAADMEAEGTDAFRLFSGSAEGRPGLTADRMGSSLLVQNFFDPLTDAENRVLADYASAHGLCLAVWPKYDREAMRERGREAMAAFKAGCGGLKVCTEQGDRFYASDISCGLDPYIYLDFRAGRRRLRAEVKERLKSAAGEKVRVLNLFSYTCTAGVAACAAGAEAVNVDFGTWCLELGRRNAALNGIPAGRFECWHEDIFPVLWQLSGLGVKGKAARRGRFMRIEPQRFDIIVLDPPTFASGRFGKVDIENDYQSLLKPCLLSLKPGGCVLAVNHSSNVSAEDWMAKMHRCAEKAGCPLSRGIELLVPDSDCPAIDGAHPVKMAMLYI